MMKKIERPDHEATKTLDDSPFARQSIQNMSFREIILMR
jgi:hypothetical protein